MGDLYCTHEYLNKYFNINAPLHCRYTRFNYEDALLLWDIQLNPLLPTNTFHTIISRSGYNINKRLSENLENQGYKFEDFIRPIENDTMTVTLRIRTNNMKKFIKRELPTEN